MYITFMNVKNVISVMNAVQGGYDPVCTACCLFGRSE